LQIGIHGQHDVAGDDSESCRQPSGLAEIATMAQGDHSRVMSGNLAHRSPGAVL
jgi:hypothetical protein